MGKKKAEGATTGRFVLVVDPKRADPATVAGQLGRRGVTVDQRLDFINTLVVSGGEKTVRAAAAEIDAISSVEPEGIMRAG